ncbi:uncharacterized protein DSM5745_09140 [Aspergillus mulundensis]|uniref:Uncharacterized protein n=1 Tax=Aspergillus mulundensis TaxID=1810919 RepID=A0A3D8R0C2_9EURO|nr:hypothetical protein DSM5745_09140 [Aspergillus mulundensis]RDW67274.1 hypothetical protein DSM5745_09140 [Aspergillus mulundensis]
MPMSGLDLGRLPWTLETTETVTSLTGLDTLAAHQFTASLAANLRESGIHTYSIVLGKDPAANGTQWTLWTQFARPDDDHHTVTAGGEKWWEPLRAVFLERIGTNDEDAGSFFTPCSEKFGRDLLGVIKNRTNVVLFKDIPYVLYKLGKFREDEWEAYGELYRELMTCLGRVQDLANMCQGKYGWSEARCLPLYRELFLELEDAVGMERLKELEGEIEGKDLSDWDRITWYRSTYQDLVGNEVVVPERRDAIWEELRAAQGRWSRVYEAIAPGFLADGDDEMQAYLDAEAEAERQMVQALDEAEEAEREARRQAEEAEEYDSELD